MKLELSLLLVILCGGTACGQRTSVPPGHVDEAFARDSVRSWVLSWNTSAGAMLATRLAEERINVSFDAERIWLTSELVRATLFKDGTVASFTLNIRRADQHNLVWHPITSELAKQVAETILSEPVHAEWVRKIVRESTNGDDVVYATSYFAKNRPQFSSGIAIRGVLRIDKRRGVVTRLDSGHPVPSRFNFPSTTSLTSTMVRPLPMLHDEALRLTARERPGVVFSVIDKGLIFSVPDFRLDRNWMTNAHHTASSLDAGHPIYQVNVRTQSGKVCHVFVDALSAQPLAFREYDLQPLSSHSPTKLTMPKIVESTWRPMALWRNSREAFILICGPKNEAVSGHVDFETRVFSSRSGSVKLPQKFIDAIKATKVAKR